MARKPWNNAAVGRLTFGTGAKAEARDICLGYAVAQAAKP